VDWRELEQAAPELAELGAKRLRDLRVALLGTVRKDGSPRISPVEPYLSQGELLFGAMTWSLKARDLRRDPRCVLHSAVTDPDAGEGELKLYGRAVVASDELRQGCREGWWFTRPETATVFALAIGQATFVSWDTEGAEMTARRWTPREGYTVARRRYP
jgi:Pyridoxamine 5'-phosphate oxidase